MGAGTWDAGRALVHETLREAHSCCHRAVGMAAAFSCLYPHPTQVMGMAIAFACLYPRPTQVMGTAAALACSCPRPTQVMGTAAALACSYPRLTRVMGTAATLACSCPRPTQAMGTAATLACSYPRPTRVMGTAAETQLRKEAPWIRFPFLTIRMNRMSPRPHRSPTGCARPGWRIMSGRSIFWARGCFCAECWSRIRFPR